jgi:type IV pilus assembly protein PilP
MMNKTCYLLCIIASAALAAGCSDSANKAPAQQPAAQTKSAPTGTAAQPATEDKVPPLFAYQPAGRRDPFTPIVIKEEKKAAGGVKAPLERYLLSEFKLSGIVWGGMGYHAMMEGPDGKGYFVKVGTVIGPNRGVVKKITPNTMTIEETFKDPTGEIKKKEITIELRKKQEGTL